MDEKRISFTFSVGTEDFYLIDGIHTGCGLPQYRIQLVVPCVSSPRLQNPGCKSDHSLFIKCPRLELLEPKLHQSIRLRRVELGSTQGQLHLLGWVHTCNVTAYRNTVS
jgi:hypothetical protein